MVPFDLDYQQTLGSPFVSFIDLSMINELYGCKMDSAANEYAEISCKATTSLFFQSPNETEIEIILLSFSNSFDNNGCVYDGVEIKTNQDQRLSGYRFCSSSAAGTHLRSYTNRVPIITWNRLYKSEMKLLYRHVPASDPRLPARTIRPPTNSDRITTELPLPADFWISGGVAPLPAEFWTSGEAARICVDHPECSLHLAAVNFCNNDHFTIAQKRSYCPRSCNLCTTPQSINSAA
ncbi:hypothetical protein OSTOST_16166 [Ostertagia ostertagi]